MILDSEGGETGRSLLGIELSPMAAPEIRRQDEGSEAEAHQAAHGHAERLEDAPHLAVASLAQHYPISAVRTPAPAGRDAVERGRSVIEDHAARQRAEMFALERSPHPHGALALDLAARVH